jgi:hypothetical protein
MSDTELSVVIVSSLDSDGAMFVPFPDDTTSDASDGLHVPGAACAEPASSGLVVDFSTLSADVRITHTYGDPPDLPASMTGGGYAAQLAGTEPSHIAGAMNLN